MAKSLALVKRGFIVKLARESSSTRSKDHDLVPFPLANARQHSTACTRLVSSTFGAGCEMLYWIASMAEPASIAAVSVLKAKDTPIVVANLLLAIMPPHMAKLKPCADMTPFMHDRQASFPLTP